MPSHYASDEEVKNLVNLGKKICAANWIFTESEADADYYAIIHDMEWIIAHLMRILNINAVINYAVASSTAPFQVVRLSENRFVILVDRNAYYDLLGLNLRIQTLPSLSEFLGTTSLELNSSYQGKYLLDIIKDFLFNPIDYQEAINATKSCMGYQASLLFIIGHEVAHMTHGHLGFKKSSYYKEFSLTEQDENLTLRTLEMDADSSGTTNVSATMEFSILKSLEMLEISEEIKRQEKSKLLRRQYITGIYVALLYSDARLKTFFTPKYPISYSRFLTAKGVLEIALRKDINEEASKTPEQVRSHLVNSFAAISGSLGSLGHPIATNMMIIEPGATEPVHQYDELGILIGLEHLEPLYSRWSRIRPILEQYQLGGELAPAISPPF
ncbi:hypothetical protein [Methylophilus sp. 5]|uniref:hypothetical protein n=1 Tax=Methylophilus sp. 5 TaxID=1112274 RepID=UPI00048BB2C4|nr:hypothetical protein [Methylophilus sp. 5]